EATSIAERGAVTGLSGLDQKDAVAVALQPARRTHPDHPGADHPNALCSGRRHRLASPFLPVRPYRRGRARRTFPCLVDWLDAPSGRWPNLRLKSTRARDLILGWASPCWRGC